MDYKSLKTVYYQQRNQYEQDYASRLNGWGTINTQLYPYLMKKQEVDTAKYPLFALPTLDIQILCQQIIENSKTITQLAEDLPTVAHDQFYTEQLYTAIIATNAIEGVRTTRKELQLAEHLIHSSQSTSAVKHLSTIRMYRDILSDKFLTITKLDHIRQIYDDLTSGEIAAEDQLDGKLFRASFVQILNPNNKVEHIAPATEEAINTMLTSWLTFINNRQFPFLFKATLAHYFFENTHPFYDGNGRTGRYILSKYLSRKLDRFSGLIINKKINEDKSSYYKAFSETGHYLNRADGTIFVHTMLTYLIKGQADIITTLTHKQEQLNHYRQKIAQLDLTPVQADIFYLILQAQLFTDSPQDVLIQTDILTILKPTEHSQRALKQAFKQLEDLHLIARIAHNPIKYNILPHFFDEELPSPKRD